MHTYAFEKLDVWQDARKRVVKIYQVTQAFPDTEKFGLVSQIRRAALSICSNIAEGSGRQTMKDQAYFYQIAYSSTLELLNQLIIASDLNFLSEDDLQALRHEAEKVTNKLNRLRHAVLSKSRSTS